MKRKVNMNDKRRILVVDTTVENCNIDTVIIDNHDNVFSLLKEDIAQLAKHLANDSENIVSALKKDGCFEDKAETVTLTYKRNGSVFGTDEITFQSWSSDEIMNRFAILYIEMPQ